MKCVDCMLAPDAEQNGVRQAKVVYGGRSLCKPHMLEAVERELDRERKWYRGRTFITETGT